MAKKYTAEQIETARTLRGKFLAGCGPLIEHKIRQATGKPSNLDLSMVSPKAQEAVWTALVPMLQQAGDIVKVQVETTQDVVELIGKGKLTLAEALQLMQVLRAESDIVDVKQMAAQLDELASGYRG